MGFVHTAHGLGRIVATETMRGRTRHKVAGPGFEVWLDSTQVRTAEDGGMFSNISDKLQRNKGEQVYHYDRIPSDHGDDLEDVYSNTPIHIERDASLGDINKDNSTTLPYNPEPQYPSDMWAHDTTIQPGEQEIDAEDRLSPSDSLNFESRSEIFPAPNPDLFAKGAARVDDWREEDWSESPFGNDHDDRYRNHPDSWSHEPTEQDYADWEAKNGKGKQANLGPKYATWMLAAPEGDDSVSRFRRDPIQEINRLGYLWTGGTEEPEMADYGRLVEADKMLRESAWADVRQKAQRLRREGRVHVLHRGPGNIYANVDGDNGTYTTMIAKTGNTQSIDKWACSCEWGRWAFQRKVSYVGRLCSHGYASYLELQSDSHKGNPGRFHQPRRTAALVDDFQDYVDDYRDGHVDIDAVDNFITLPEHNSPRLDSGQVDDLYNWAWDNRTEVEPRNFKMPYMAAAEEGEPRLRTTPRSLTPDLMVVPGPEDSYFTDVEEDERETTGPDGIMHTAMVDALGNPYTPAGFWRTAEPVVEDDETSQSVAGDAASTAGQDSQTAGQVSDPSVETPRVPSTESAPASKEEEYGSSDSAMGGFDMGTFSDIAGPVIDGLSSAAMPVAEGIGSMISGIGSSILSYRTADCENNAEELERKVEHLRDLVDEDPDLGDRDEQNDEIRESTEYLRGHGLDISPIVANYDSGPATVFGGPPGGAFGQPGGGPWADRSYAGSGPDPKWWYSTSEEPIAEYLDGDGVEQVDVTEGEGETNYLSESERPSQGKSARRRYAEDRDEPDFFPEDKGRKSEPPHHKYEPDMEREGAANDIVRQFQASGGGALANSGGGSFGDDDIAGQARKFLAKTAGRVYSLAEQRELVEESHPSGARNKPTDDDLAGTHYV